MELAFLEELVLFVVATVAEVIIELCIEMLLEDRFAVRLIAKTLLIGNALLLQLAVVRARVIYHFYYLNHPPHGVLGFWGFGVDSY